MFPTFLIFPIFLKKSLLFPSHLIYYFSQSLFLHPVWPPLGKQANWFKRGIMGNRFLDCRFVHNESWCSFNLVFYALGSSSYVGAWTWGFPALPTLPLCYFCRFFHWWWIRSIIFGPITQQNLSLILWCSIIDIAFLLHRRCLLNILGHAVTWMSTVFHSIITRYILLQCATLWLICISSHLDKI